MESSQAIQEFISAVSGLKEYDYGDFKRKANSYLIHLEESLPQTSQGKNLPAVQKKLNSIREFLVYNAEPNVARVQERLLSAIQELKTLLT